ncbi:MAG: hypothetical protein Q8O38_15335 [Sulfurimicrobium sp.]|nr:hypothetical protein [Sulfurimicrobium sp.]
MPLSWNEIKSRAIGFSKEWQNESSEDAEAKSFWDGFFNIFGISRKRLASFEEPVKKLGDKQGFIDLFWKGVLLVEHKSRGRNLDKAYTQALDKAVDVAYGKTGFITETERVAFLFERYQQLTSLLPAASSSKGGKVRKTSQQGKNE